MTTNHTSYDIDDCWNKIGVWGVDRNSCQRLISFGHCQNCPVYSDTGRHLLTQPLSQDYREELSRLYNSILSTEEADVQKQFVFRIGNEWFGMRNSLIKEVVEMSPIHSIPHKSSRIFLGIVSIRGKLELCVSIGGILRIKPAKKKQGIISPERLVVVSKAGQNVVYPVSDVLGPVRYEPHELMTLPASVTGSRAVYVKNTLQVENKNVSLLDDAMLFRILTRNLG